MRSPIRVILALVLLSYAQNRNAQEEPVLNNPEIERPYAPPIIFEKNLRSDSEAPSAKPNVDPVPVPKTEEEQVLQVPQTEVPENLPDPKILKTSETVPPPKIESTHIETEPQTHLNHDLPLARDVPNDEPGGSSGLPPLALVLPSDLLPVVTSTIESGNVLDETEAHVKSQEDSQESVFQSDADPQQSEQEDGQPALDSGEEKSTDEAQSPDKSILESVNRSEDIPSFSEWTQLQLSQRKEAIINNIKNKTSLQEGKNFASPDCGAKVINSNPEAQNPSGIISSSHDEYMLNRCTVNTWFILELCEPLKIEQVSIGNLELFSSNPHEFELGVSDRYPTRDWTILGPYFAPDARNMHSFPLPTNNSTFGKFLRILVRSHHGNEHYCPLSILKVYGRSEYEVLESETTHAEDEESNSNSVFEEEVNDDKPVGKSVLGTATEAVLDLVKKAANALVNNEMLKSESDETSTPLQLAHVTATNNSSTCITLKQCIRESEHKELVSSILSCNTSLLLWLRHVVPWCGWEYCHSLLKARSIGSPWMPEGLFMALYGPSIMEALCNFNKPIQSCDVVENKNTLVELTSGVPNDTAAAGSKDGLPGVIIVSPPASVNPVDKSDEAPVSSATPAVLSPMISPQQPQQTAHQEAISNAPPFEEPAQKESVFVRLSNRIKNLERNQSLSSGYLEELSRRFKKQNEDLNTAHETFRKTLNESLTKCKRVEDNLRYEVRKLNRNIDNLRELIWRVEMQRGGLVLFSVLQFLFTVFCWWTREKRGQEVKVSGQSQSSVSPSADLLPLQRKRNNSETLKSVKKKKKRKEAVALAQALSKSQGQSPAPSQGPFQSTSNNVPKPQPVPSLSPPFEFKSPTIVKNSTSTGPGILGSSSNQSQVKSQEVLKPAISLSSVSDNSVSEDSVQGHGGSFKKKSKLKSFFFGAGGSGK